jgi:predicted site-specific integrase-resolvase
MESKKVYMNDVEAAKMLGLSPQTLRNWRCKGLGPEYVRLNSRCIRYKLEALENYMSRHRVIPYQELSGFE